MRIADHPVMQAWVLFDTCPLRPAKIRGNHLPFLADAYQWYWPHATPPGDHHGAHPTGPAGALAEAGALCAELAASYAGVEDERFLTDCVVLAHRLPGRLRSRLCRSRLVEPAAALVVSGLPVDDGEIGPFRRGGRRAGGGGGAGYEHEQSGASSDVDLLWRTEEAFHPLRGDYVALLCLRDPDRTPTMVATVHTNLEERSCRRAPTPRPARTARGHRASGSCRGPPGMS